MFKKAAVALALGMTLSGTAFAEAWTFNYAAANLAEGYTPPALAGLDAPQSALIDELKFTAESMVVFTGGSIPFTNGATFTDYIVLRVDQANIGGNLAVDPLNNTPPIRDRQITAVIQANGQYINALGDYIISPLGFSFNVYYDAGPGLLGGVGGVFTQADFGPNLAAFADGTNVENASLIAGGGDSSQLIIPDGNIDLIVLMNNLLPGGFELFDGLFDPLKLVFGISDANNALCQADGGTGTCGNNATNGGMASAVAAFNALFGTALADTDNVFYTRSDGSFTKAIPEPATLALMGLGLLGMGAAARRRKSS